MLEIISYWSDKLSSILDYFTFVPQKKYFTQRCIQSASLRLGTHSFFFWTQNIEWRVQLDAEKRSNVYAKTQRHTIRKFGFRENNFYQLIDSSVKVYFAVNFQTKAEKPGIVFSHHFPQPLLLSLLRLNFHVLRDVIRVGFWWDNRRHCRSANNKLPFQSILGLLHAFQANFKV